MGAEQFGQFQGGDDLESAFRSAVDEALYDFGHSGYTGTIAEKTDVELRGTVATLDEAEEFAEKDLDKNDHDKWGNCWAVKITNKDQRGFYFYGYASS